jgi:type I restriction enzyme S subunit
MTAHKRHAAMKDSGVAWLGKIPAHWDVVQSRRMFDERKEKARPGDVLLTASQKYGMIPQSEFMELEGRRVVEINKGANSLIHVEAGDFVISLRSFQGGLEFSRTAGSITFHYVPIHAVKGVHEPFFAHLFKSSTYIQALRATANLIRDGQDMRFSHFAQVPLPVVPMKEQVAIADHLDHETARIDNLTARKTRFIELLAEKRQALIIHVVTKGLTPKAKMKDSGVEWVGQVPEHWSVCKINFRFSIALGKMLDEKRNVGRHPVKYLRNQDVQWAGINTNGLPEMDISPVELERYTARSGDLLVCEGGDVGRASIWNGEPIGYQKALHRLRPRFEDSVEYMRFALMSAKFNGAFEESDTKSTISHLPAEKFRTFKFPFPPADEQDSIVQNLKEKTARIDALIARTERSIELLREHRTALITAAVTGKIDLRENA